MDSPVGPTGPIPISKGGKIMTYTRVFHTSSVRHIRTKPLRRWQRQTPRVAYPITITKPNGEVITVAPTRKRVARKVKAPAQVVAIREQDTRAIALDTKIALWQKEERHNLEALGWRVVDGEWVHG